MKQRFTTLAVLFMLSLATAWSITVQDPTQLKCSNVWVEGSCRAKLVQKLHVMITNPGQNCSPGEWYMRNLDTGKEELFCLNSEFQKMIPGGTTVDAYGLFRLEDSGSYRFEMVAKYGTAEQKLFVFSVDIGEYVAPQLSGKLRLDMMESTGEGNIIYGDFSHFRISGTATVTNNGDELFIADGQVLTGSPACIKVSVPTALNPRYFDAYISQTVITGELQPGETADYDFCYDFEFTGNKDESYNITIQSYPGGLLYSIPVFLRQCTKTYWTAEGSVKPLPVDEGNTLRVPSEALAVDLRGLYSLNDSYNIDVSEANPNCLFYLAFLDNVPRGLTSEVNVIRDYEAKTLIVDADYDYYCPLPFRAKTAMFNFTPETEATRVFNIPTSQRKLVALILPFDTRNAFYDDINSGHDSDIDSELIVMKYQGSSTSNELNFKLIEESELKSYTPYLMYMAPTSITFYTEETIVPATREAIVTDERYDFVGHTVATHTHIGVYRVHPDQLLFYEDHPDGMVRPFTAVMEERFINPKEWTGYNKPLIIMDAAGPSTNGVNQPFANPRPGAQDIYSLSGQRQEADRLKPGIYINNGRKIIVK